MLRIKEVAKSKGITITELAEKMGVTQVTLSRTINGNPTIETLLKIANVLEVDVRELIEPTEQSNLTEIYIKEKDAFVSIGFLKL